MISNLQNCFILRKFVIFSLGMNDTQGTLSKAERKRQQAIQELMNTEESYNSDMQIALEVC